MLKGFVNGFLPYILEMPRVSDFVMLGIFPLLEKNSSLLAGSCKALGPTFRRGEVVRRSLVDSNPKSQGRLNGASNEIVIGEDVLELGGEVTMLMKTVPNRGRCFHRKAFMKEGQVGPLPINMIYPNLMDIYINDYNGLSSFCKKIQSGGVSDGPRKDQRIGSKLARVNNNGQVNLLGQVCVMGLWLLMGWEKMRRMVISGVI